MPYTPQDRATFVALLGHLGPDGHADEVVGFVRDHWRESLDELAARPGWDQVRAGLIRVVPALLGPTERREALDAAREALRAYPEDVAAGDPSVSIARHPAWVGLCALELADQEGEPRAAALDRAVSLATVGFRSTGGSAVGRGEVLWALAEQADEVGWSDRARALLEAALRAPFADASAEVRVKLLLGLRQVEDGDEAGAETLGQVAEDGAADEQTRVHALWVLAALARRDGDVDQARQALERAATLVDPEDEPDVAERIRGALEDLDDGD